MRFYSFFTAFLLLPIVTCFGQNPVSHLGSDWDLNSAYSDEFNMTHIDSIKWNTDVNDWGTWSWEPSNAYITEDSATSDTVLTLQMVQKSHSRNNKQFYFTSGICRNVNTITYGYFETRIKASEKGQGSCPAFWLYSVGQPTPQQEGGVKYSEIDVVEIFQKPYDFQRLEMNLHTRIIQNGVLTWIRPGQGHADLTHNTWLAPWDPRDDYHTYGVWSRLDSIFWYVDGIQRGAKKNYYWHLPMYPTVSMGLRTPYERYINGVRTIMPFPDSIPEPGFPTEMYCDYVRIWNTDPQLYADKEKYYNAEFPINNDLDFDCRFFAGNGESVLMTGFNGMTCKLQEIQSDSTIVNEYLVVDSTIVGTESGITTLRFSLLGLPPSSALPAGNKYVLKPSFRTSFNGGEDVFLKESFYPITLISNTSINDEEAQDKIKIMNSSEGVVIRLAADIVNQADIKIYDLAGKEIFNSKASSSKTIINKARFSAGIYVVSVMTNKLHRTEKILY